MNNDQETPEARRERLRQQELKRNPAAMHGGGLVVTFKNEPYIEYLYFAHGRVRQFEFQIIDKEFKRITKEDLRNYDPNSLIN